MSSLRGCLSALPTADWHGLDECRALAAQWKMNLELAIDLASLSLYDTVIYCGALRSCRCMPRTCKQSAKYVGVTAVNAPNLGAVDHSQAAASCRNMLTAAPDFAHPPPAASR